MKSTRNGDVVGDRRRRGGHLLLTLSLHGQHIVDRIIDQRQLYNADIEPKVDPDGSALSDWTLSWTGSPTVEHSWNCSHSDEGERTVLGVWYNETIQPGTRRCSASRDRAWPPAPVTSIRTVDVPIDGEGDDGNGGGGGDGGHGGDDGGHDEGGHEGCCFGDLDGDHRIDGQDLTYMLSVWNVDDPVADLDGSSMVDGADLNMLLSLWGECGDDSHGDDSHGHGEYMDITMWGDFPARTNPPRPDGRREGDHHHRGDGRYNDLRAFLDLPVVRASRTVGIRRGVDERTQAWATTSREFISYAMQGAKVGWITDDLRSPDHGGHPARHAPCAIRSR